MLATYRWTTNYAQTTCTYYLTLFAGQESGLGLAGCSAYRVSPEAAVTVSAGAGGSASKLARVVLDGIRCPWAVGPRPRLLAGCWPEAIAAPCHVASPTWQLAASKCASREGHRESASFVI